MSRETFFGETFLEETETADLGSDFGMVARVVSAVMATANRGSSLAQN
jgi:hypothetical protein